MPPRNLAKLLSVLGPFLVLLFVTLLFAALLGAKDAASRHGDNPTEDLKNFFSTVNVVTILAQSVIVAIGALGMTLIIVSGGIDLSVGSVIALTSVTGAVLLRASWASGSALLVTVLAGGVVGLVNGALIAGLRMTPFIVTLGMLGIARGVAKWLADNATVNSDHITNSAIAGLMRDANWLGLALPPGVVIAFVLAVLTAVVMRHTVFGRHIFAIGSNEATARLCGIRTRLVKIGLYSMAGLYFGLAGVMQLSRLRQGDPTAAAGSSRTSACARICCLAPTTPQPERAVMTRWRTSRPSSRACASGTRRWPERSRAASSRWSPSAAASWLARRCS